MDLYIGKTNDLLDKLYDLKNSTSLSDAEEEAIKKQIELTETNLSAIEKYKDEFKAMLTGTTASSITDSIIEGFKNGYKSMEDFAANFEELMKGAVIQALKVKSLEKPLSDWYDEFAGASESDGMLTAEEIAALQKQYSDIITNAGSEFENLKKITGVDFSSSAQQKAESGSITTVTEDTASKLEGHFVAVRVNTGRLVDIGEASRELLYKSQLNLAKIERNTNELYRLEAMENVLKRMETDGIKLKN